ncbi:DUF3093 domain-containing protein [Brevibacterium atlanticum]|uniref:DUF3093 domain-containing protein n=1 Tax=Brevibacterium atlanticum TaxID=2697563 RepID=UPI0014235AE1|nr:DUF3093 domain-containing protein [Brevibacterium atlanticum]
MATTQSGTNATTQSGTNVVYQEKVRPSVGMWILVVVAAASTALMVLPVWKLGTIILPVISFVLFAWWLNSLTVSIIVTQRQLFVGEAHIDRTFVPGATAYDGEEARAARGVDLDARAFLKIRPWVKPVVRIDLDDENDPTPYWLVSTRHPTQLAAALTP